MLLLMGLSADVPEGNVTVFVAPTDTAFEAVLKALNLDVDELLKDTELLTSVLGVHVGSAANAEATSATLVSGDILTFSINGAETPLITFDDSTAGATVLGPANNATTSATLGCKSNTQFFFLVDTVLLPGPTPGPGPSPAPSPSAGFAATAMAGMAALAFLQMLL